LAVGVAVAERVAGDQLDHAVDALALGVAVAGVDERGDLGPPAVDGDGESADFGDVAVRAPGQELPPGMTHLFTVGVHTSQGEEGAQAFLGDPRGQQPLPDRPFVQQRVPRPLELLVGQVLTIAEQAVAGLPFGVGGPSSPAAALGGGAAPHQGEHLVGELDDVEMTDHDHGVRESVRIAAR
jgi:hypothetical protein